MAPNLPSDFQLDQHSNLTRSVGLAEIILVEDNANPLMGFATIFQNNNKRITNHIEAIIEFALGHSNLCRNKPFEAI
ncbi:hypothetical protein [Flavihumibacter sp. UBA7668]|uniref:hypothetical protein n=1 Tax=Flavihumibacter sp. UBA7668 TaxID=1946542 RepID=UPI0025BB2A81|nr:hypothetical protein [Flavihumibacter sp. UBA7668]